MQMGSELDRVLACPHCGSLIRTPARGAGSSEGGTVWSDGKRVSPDQPRTPEFVQCGDCSDYYWLEAAEEVGQVAAEAEPSRASDQEQAWLRAPRVESLTQEQYWHAIDSGFAARDSMEILLRLLAWWRSNDPLREDRAQLSTWPARAEDNAHRLLTLLNPESTEHRMIEAEILRRLGRFEECLQVLDKVGDPELEPAVSRLRQLALAGDRSVAVLWG